MFDIQNGIAPKKTYLPIPAASILTARDQLHLLSNAFYINNLGWKYKKMPFHVWMQKYGMGFQCR